MYLYGGVGWLLPALVGHKYISASVMPWHNHFPSLFRKLAA